MNCRRHKRTQDGLEREDKLFVRNLMLSFLGLNDCENQEEAKNWNVYERKTRKKELQTNQDNHGKWKYEDASAQNLKRLNNMPNIKVTENLTRKERDKVKEWQCKAEAKKSGNAKL